MSLAKGLCRFGANKSGSVATVFAFAFVPALISVGVGMDFARAIAERDRLQQGADASALAGIQAIRKGQTLVQATTLVGQVLGVNDPNPNVSVTSVTLSSDGTTLCVAAQSSVDTSIMNAFGYATVPVGAKACSKMRLDTYEIAIAIDNSASMKNSAQSNGQTKMQAAQQAAKGLISALAGNGTGNSVKASYAIVPFSSAVNVGAGYYAAGASWLDLDGQSSIHWKSFTFPLPSSHASSLFDVYNNIGVAWGGCVEERPAPYTTSDTTPNQASPDTLFAPFFWPDETDVAPYGYSQLIFNNYIGDNSGSCKANDNYAVADGYSPGRGDGQTKYCKYTGKIKLKDNSYYVTGQAASPNAGCATPALTPLNATNSVITSAIDAMTPVGDTALAPGFMWAWRTISPKGPFRNDGADGTTSGQQKPKVYNYVNPTNFAVNHKIVILLTDGMNDWFGQDGDGYTQYTQYDPNKMVYNAFGWPQEGRLGTTTTSTARSLLDQTTQSACTAAKNATDSSGNSAPVEVYTVGFLATDGIDSTGQSLLKSCATDANHAFIATTGDQLVQVFQKIAAQISQPRLAM